MNEKDAAIIKTLAELGLYKETPLTHEQEKLFNRAIDPEEDFLQSVEEIFHVNESDEFTNQKIDRKHLYNIVKARCREFFIYYNYLQTQHPGIITLPWTFEDLVDPPFEGDMSISGERNYWLDRTEQSLLTEPQLHKFDEKLRRMIQAMKAMKAMKAFDNSRGYQLDF